MMMIEVVVVVVMISDVIFHHDAPLLISHRAKLQFGTIERCGTIGHDLSDGNKLERFD